MILSDILAFSKMFLEKAKIYMYTYVLGNITSPFHRIIEDDKMFTFLMIFFSKTLFNVVLNLISLRFFNNIK